MTQFTLSAFADEASPEFDRQIAALHRKHISLMEIRGVDGKGILDLTDEELDVVEKKLAAGNIGISAIGSPIGKIGIEDDLHRTSRNSSALWRLRKSCTPRAFVCSASIFRRAKIRRFITIP